ncbi:C6 transcription factor, putative [Talaromyces stipitatus ATCC 10500]|uniref:C6 transcription factor, putative n=1 Tax=Talaromyces stipitatus (strain ATCC 10500 / CBS 375.48 / QM 6759 / NRRL 1006) TaxID=441959 RepID=B8MSZ9_TALSN|nr:C6 transcription factor, putative [Talaromyces stipitatus ATCC 10500]EED12155.1 C6 transcription factor, putative [Talaromyces stipitatus ATCC 10500]
MAAVPRDIDSFNSRKPVLRRYNVERSCIRCHERKIRCDRKTPCSTCTKANAQCQYPGPEKGRRRSKREQQSQLVPRIDEHDDHLDVTRSSQELSPAIPTGNQKTQNVSEGQSLDSNRGFLLKDGASTRYINEGLLSQVLEKETELQSAIDTPGSVGTLEPRAPTLGFRGLISIPCIVTTDLSTLYPSRWQATRLWHVWLNNVNPVLKLLHIPTIQPAFFAAINSPAQVSADFSALLFSIYFAAVTSIDSSEAALILGQCHQAALNNFQYGLELSLHNAGFLDSPTIASVQAMSMYLTCRRNHNSGRSGWALNGLLVRASQSIGLHRDGEHFNLPPLDCEIRRRLWWHVSGLDGRVAEDHGIIIGGLGTLCDTKLPLNIDDADLIACMKDPPQPKKGATEMSLSLILAESNVTTQEIHHIMSRGQNGDEKVAHLKQILQDFKARMEEQYFQYLDINIPIQRYALLLGRMQLAKMEVMARQQYLRGKSVEKSSELACDESLMYAIEVLEKNIMLKTDDLLRNFQWLASSFAQYSALTHVLWHLCVWPESQNTDKVWSIVERSFELEELPSFPGLNQK